MAVGATVDLPTIRQRITVDDSALSGVAGRFGKIGKALGSAVAIGAGAAAIGIGAFVAKGVSGAIEIERGLREVNTLLGVTGKAAEESLAGMQGELRGLSDTIGVAQDELVGGLYQAISSGVPKDNAFAFLEVAGRAAIGGVTDVETAVDGLTTTINAFGLDASQAEAVADSMFTAVKGGKTTFEELSASLFQVAPAAAAAGVSFQEVNAGIATLTAAGTPTAVATTQMRAALTGLQRPSEELNGIFQNLGFESAQAALEQEGLGFALRAVAKEADGDNGKLTQLLGSVEAVAAANVIAGTGAEKFASELDAQADSAGASQTAFEEMEKSTSRQMEKLGVTLGNVGTTLGAELLPVLNTIIGALAEHLPAAIETVTSFVGPLIEGIAGLVGGLSDGSTATVGLGETIGTVFAAVGAVLAGFVETIQAVVAVIAGWVADNQEKIRALGSTIGEVFAAIGETITTILELVSIAWETFGDTILNFITDRLAAVVRIVGGALDVIRGVFETFIGIFTGDWSRAWDGIKSIFSGVWDVMVGVVEAVWANIKLVVSLAIDALKLLFGEPLQALATLFSGVWSGIASFFSDTWDSMVGVAKGAVNIILEAINTIIRAWNGLDFTVPSVKIPGLGTVGGGTIGLPDLDQIPKLGTGGDLLSAGLVRINERTGPGEVVSLPKGAQVRPHNKVDRGDTNVEVNLHGRTDADLGERDIIRAVRRAVGPAYAIGGR